MIKTEKPEEYQDRLHRVVSVSHLTDSLFILTLEKRQFEFEAGQFVLVGLPGDSVKREYSIFSGSHDNELELLIREVPDGDLSGKLRKLHGGDELIVDGPAGDFTLPKSRRDQPYLFIASGTGISPFRSMVRSYPDLDYQIILGVRNQEDLVLTDGIPEDRMITCTSRDHSGSYHGYVTEYLTNHVPDPDTQVFFCGNGNMVYDGFNLLTAKGFSREQLHAEIFF